MTGICWPETRVADNTTRFKSSILRRTSVLQDIYEFQKRVKLQPDVKNYDRMVASQSLPTLYNVALREVDGSHSA